jgi:hypothetical protein
MRVPSERVVLSYPCRECGRGSFSVIQRNGRVRLSCVRCLHSRWQDAEELSDRLPPRVEEPRSEPAPPRPPAWSPPAFPSEGFFRDQDVASNYGTFKAIHPRNPDGSLHERDVRRWQLRQLEIANDHRRRSQSAWTTDESSRWPRRG